MPADLLARCSWLRLVGDAPIASESLLTQLGPIIVQETSTATMNTTSVAGIATLTPFGALVPSPGIDFPADVEPLAADPNHVYQLTGSGAASYYDTSGLNTPLSTITPPRDSHGAIWRPIPCTLDLCENPAGCLHMYQCVDFCNTASIAINDSNTPPTIAAPYSSTISVSGLGANGTLAKVTLQGLGHTFPDDIDVLLVGPGGAERNRHVGRRRDRRCCRGQSHARGRGRAPSLEVVCHHQL